MRHNRKLVVAGLLVGLLSLASYPALFAATPLVPTLIAAVAAVPPKTRPFALGALIAAAIGFVALIVFLAILSSSPPGTEHYGP
jgi:hypothetical protein